jgi:hypothetical protein
LFWSVVSIPDSAATSLLNVVDACWASPHWRAETAEATALRSAPNELA